MQIQRVCKKYINKLKSDIHSTKFNLSYALKIYKVKIQPKWQISLESTYARNKMKQTYVRGRMVTGYILFD